MEQHIDVRSLAPLRRTGIPDSVQRLDYASPADHAADWALVYPPESGDTWIVMIHGHGSTGDQLYTRPDIRETWLPAFRAMGAGILTPNLRGNAWMSPRAASDMRGLLEWVRTEFGARRYVFASGSMGGTSNLAYAALHPDDAAAVVALCPATDIASYLSWCRTTDTAICREIAHAIQTAYGASARRGAADLGARSAVRNHVRLTMPVYVAHGAADTVIPVSQTRRLVGAMAEASHLAYTEIPEGDHDSPLAWMPSALRWVSTHMAPRVL